MKRSLSVPLVMLGTMGMGMVMTGCGQSNNDPDYLGSSSDIPTMVDVKRDLYASKEDCQKDWGNADDYCKPSVPSDFTTSADGPPSGSAGMVASGSAGAGTPSGHSSGGGIVPWVIPSGSTSAVSSYSGPRYFWHRDGNTGYPMQMLSDGSTRRIQGASITPNGSSLAKASLSTKAATPKSYVAARQASIARSGFGGRSASISGGG